MIGAKKMEEKYFSSIFDFYFFMHESTIPFSFAHLLNMMLHQLVSTHTAIIPLYFYIFLNALPNAKVSVL